MTIKLKGICINLKKERSIRKLHKLITACKIEATQELCSKAKREFLQIVIKMIHTRISLVTTEPALIIA
tara:strand:- start:710 stop:916 length:207 start_codon:yes stop_codon:yes gene_type:complete